MKKVLIFHANQQSIAEIQAILVEQCQVYATDRIKTVSEFLRQKQVDYLIIYLPSGTDAEMKHQSLKLLRYLNRKRYLQIIKILVCPNQDEQPVRNYLSYGVTAIIADTQGLKQIIRQGNDPARL
ncbi:hypothetical protein JW964_09185 [candidate division KSB1 bacterium]|nr:hypothetical protein [candidate division KSB1 bacterium]